MTGQKIEALRAELVEMVQDYLSPVAVRYQYSSAPLDATIKWRPMVLVLGNYSSGKSTLINELVGVNVQATGQAPTDDCFTVITAPEGQPFAAGVPITEREGQVLLNDPVFPFEGLKRHGAGFASHFRLKRVEAPILRELAIVDTPGMLDSVTENDRSYSYQEVIGDLAQIADLVVVMFDPHKAGTIKESYESLRRTLPQATFEDRVVFVLNRVDECQNLNDLLRVYGTLCWNLSQMLGRKDIPRILLSHSIKEAAVGGRKVPEFLKLLANEHDKLRHLVEAAPRHRLDHLTAFVEMHGDRLCHFLESLVSFHRQRRLHRLKIIGNGLVMSVVAGALFGLGMWTQWIPVGADVNTSIIGGSVVGLLALLICLGPFRGWSERSFLSGLAMRLDDLTALNSQERKDNWQKIRPVVLDFIQNRSQSIPVSQIKQDLKDVRTSYRKSARAAREALAQR